MLELIYIKFNETDETRMACLISPLYWHDAFESEYDTILNI